MIKRKVLGEIERELASDKTVVLTGMRRVGKTTVVRHLYGTLTDVRKVYLDLENPLNQEVFETPDYDQIKLNLEGVAIGEGKRLVVFLDEIQNVKNLPSVVKYLSDHYQIKFLLTGSASFYLKNLFSESLAGRKRIIEMFPLDFEEFLEFKAPGAQKPALFNKIDRVTFLRLEKYWQEYLMYGGFPSVVLAVTTEEKMKELGDIYTSYFQKEVKGLSDFRKLGAVTDIMSLLATRVGSKLDVSKIAAELGVTRITVEEYLGFLKGTYFLSLVSPYSRKLDVTLRGQRKPYLCDSGILKLSGVTGGLALENVIFNLLRPYGMVNYYQTPAGAEIDFIVVDDRRKTLAFEVKTQALKTDVNKLSRQAKKMHIKDYFVVSQKYSPLPHVVFPFQL